MFGCYMAWFRHIHGIVALALFLTVEAQDLTLVSRPPDVTYVELGKTLTLNVTYQTTSAVGVTWRKGGKILYTTLFGSTDPRVSIKGQATLVLINTTLSDNGTYKNTVATAAIAEDIYLIVIIQDKPKITSFNSDQKNNISLVGKTVTITCVANAFPAPNYIIFHNGMELTDVVDGVKTIQSANLSDDGRYECVANNSFGRVSASFNLTVNVQPTAVINCPTNNTVKEGDDFNCLCNSTGGNPPPTASWYKDDNLVSGPGYLKTILSLKNINGTDTGNYSCIVESHDLNDTKSVEIQVQYKPQITSFNSDQKNNISLVGKTVTITCVADAFPAPNYIIVHNGMKLTDVVHGMKTIQSANLSDDGRYECVANNIFGNVSASFNLTVNVQPFAVTNCSTPLRVKNGDDVLCLCSSEGGNPAPTALWYKDGIVVNGAGYSKNLLFLKNISKSDSGTSYRCVVKSLSLSNATQVVIQVHFHAKEAGDSDILPVMAIVGIVVGVVVLLISLVVLLVLLIRYGSKKRNESKVALRDRTSSHGSSANDSDEGNPYESVDKVKVKPTEEAGTSGLPSMPPVYAAVDKVAQKKEREAKPVPLTYASLDPVLLQPDSSKMHDRSREETKYATIAIENLHSDKI